MMIPRKPLLHVVLVLGLVSGTGTLLAQLARPQSPSPSPSQVPSQSSQVPSKRATTANVTAPRGKTQTARSAASSQAPLRLAQAAAPGAPGVPMSPLEAQSAARREKAARDFMTARGFSDKSTQDAIIGYLQEQENARAALAEAGRALLPALATQGGDATTDTEVESLVAQYQKQLAAYNSQNQKDQAALDAEIGYSKKPRLGAMLLLMGALDQGPRILPVWRPLRPEGVSRPRQGRPAA